MGNEKKKRTNNGVYELVCIFEKNKRVVIESKKKIDEIDEYTINFDNFYDLCDAILERCFCYSKFWDDRILDCFIQRSDGNRVRYDILYSSDDLKSDRKKEEVMKKFEELCMKDRSYFHNFQKENIKITVDTYYYNDLVSQFLHSYFYKDGRINYRAVRGAYLKLKKYYFKDAKNNNDNRLINVFGDKENSSKYFYYIEDEEYSHLSYLLGFDPDWDEISKLPDEIKAKIKRVERDNLNGKGRKLY